MGTGQARDIKGKRNTGTGTGKFIMKNNTDF